MSEPKTCQANNCGKVAERRLLVKLERPLRRDEGYLLNATAALRVWLCPSCAGAFEEVVNEHRRFLNATATDDTPRLANVLTNASRRV